jgi:hypothetical protein
MPGTAEEQPIGGGYGGWTDRPHRHGPDRPDARGVAAHDRVSRAVTSGGTSPTG